jgi:hypothetical protein
MVKNNNALLAWVASSLVATVVAGCAHPQTVTLTSAAAPAPPAPVASAPVEETEDATEEVSADAPAKAEEKKPDGPMSFEQLTAALGEGGSKLSLDVNGTTAPAPAGKGLSADGYSAVGAAHQAVDTWSAARAVGEIKVSGGMTAAAVRSGVHDGADRLRICYEHGLASNPRLNGRVVVSFSIDAQGAVSSVDAQSDAIPSDVTSCVRDAFSAMTFSAPKSAPAKIVYPIDFNKDS